MERETEVVKIFGGPGSGKTTTVVGNTDLDGFQGILHGMLGNNYPESILLIAYTRSAADTAKNRLAKLTDINKGVLDKRITTIHSLTMGYNKIYPDSIVETRRENDKKNFCEMYDIQYESSYDDDDDIMDVPDDTGHLLFRILSWLKSNMLDAEDWQECPISTEWTEGDEIIEMSEDWDVYKMNRNIWEFDDIIEKSVREEHTVDTKHLFVDEVQDLYPLQQAFLDNQFGVVDRIWLAGDDDQCIYEWSGADPTYFLDMHGYLHNDPEEKFWGDKQGYWENEGVYILNQSFRMPNDILHLADDCIERVDNRQEKELKPYSDGGEFVPLRFSYPGRIIDLINHEDTFMLFRANYQANKFGKDLIERGIPFTDRFKTWRESTVNLRDGIAAVKNGDEYMGGGPASQIITELPRDLLSNPNERKKLSTYYASQKEVNTDNVIENTNLPKPETEFQINRWMRDFEERNWFQEKAVRQNIKKDNEHLSPSGLTLETIHWSKGREADTVILSLNTTTTVMENMIGRDIPDSERRLYYVGMTRAKRKLVMAESLDENSPSFNVTDLLGNSWREKYDYADDLESRN